MYKIYKEVWEELTGINGPFSVGEIEVRGSPMRVYDKAPNNLADLWNPTKEFGSSEYLVFGDERWTYENAHKEVFSISSWLKTQGVAKGDRVAIAMRNYPEWILIYWACVSSGIVAVGMNAWWVPDEMEYGLSDSKPKVLFADSERLERFFDINSDFGAMKVVGVRTKEAQPNVIDYQDVKETLGVPPAVDIKPDDDVCIFYTSGTTGYPKGAQLTHRGCVHNIMNLTFAGQVSLIATCRIQGVPEPNPEDTPAPNALLTTPMFHVTANNCVAHMTTIAGGKLVHMYRWEAIEALKLIEREKITSMSGVPVMSRELLNHPDFERYDTSSLLNLGGGGAQLQPDLVEKIDSSGGARPSTGYGMTETSGIITSIAGIFFLDKPESCGPAMPVFETKIVNADGVEQPIGHDGELWVRGAPVIKGYINRPDATSEAITDGWLHTGDVARCDEDGFIFIVDRVKDMVLRGGENVYCSEVETALHKISEISECSVFGVPDDRLGEEVGAIIYLVPESAKTVSEIREFCFAHMAKHKVPKYIWFSDSPLPRNANGKFLKRELRESLDLKNAL